MSREVDRDRRFVRGACPPSWPDNPALDSGAIADVWRGTRVEVQAGTFPECSTPMRLTEGDVKALREGLSRSAFGLTR
jgi:hypothetical protein